MKVRRVADIQEAHETIQKDLNRLEKWNNKTSMELKESPASGEGKSQAPIHARGYPSTKQFCRRDPEGPGEYQAECEPDLLPHVHVQQNWLTIFWAALGDLMSGDVILLSNHLDVD